MHVIQLQVYTYPIQVKCTSFNYRSTCIPFKSNARDSTTGLNVSHSVERHVFIFNDALNTFYLRLYGVRHIVKDHSDREKGNPLPPHRLLLSISSKGSFYMHHPTDRITHTTAFVTPVVEHWRIPFKSNARDSTTGLHVSFVF